MKYLLTLLLIAFAAVATAQRRVSVGFWNVENLFDTIDNPFTGDDAFTPGGANHWNTERYNRKIANLARVLDQMNLDVVGLAEVENEGVLRDLVRAMKTDYAYAFASTGDRRGISQALLYKGDKFFPDPGRQGMRLVRAASGRGFLHVRGKLCGQRVDLVVCHMPSNFNSDAFRTSAMASLRRFADSLHRTDSAARPILMGDMNASPGDGLMRRQMQPAKRAGSPQLHNPFLHDARSGRGSYVYNDRWLMYDQIILSGRLMDGRGLRYDSHGIFIREYMLSGGADGRRGYPLRTFSRGAYLGGYSDHLPVYVYLVF